MQSLALMVASISLPVRTNPEFKAEFNFYNVHYAFTHIVGTSGGNTDDMIESLKLMSEGKINPAIMVTHIGGLDAVVETTLNLPQDSRVGKNSSIRIFQCRWFHSTNLGNWEKDNKLYAGLHEIVSKNDYIWCLEAEKYLLANAKPI